MHGTNRFSLKIDVKGSFKKKAVFMKPFIKLADPSKYVACNWDLRADRASGDYWIAFFKRHLETILHLGTQAATSGGEAPSDVLARTVACRAAFHRFFDAVLDSPPDSGPVTILRLDVWRDGILRRHGFVDAFADLKNSENAKMLPLLPGVCRELDAMHADPRGQLGAAVLGVFAGNIFDMGAEATTKAFLSGGGPDFFSVRGNITPRPWLFDDFDTFADRALRDVAYRKVVYFIDNAGSDFLLGALPLMRWFAGRGARIVLAANERPTLNDMTIHDVSAWWGRIVEVEPSLKNLDIQRVSTGTGEPLIDLGAVSDELNDAATDADLVILEGMGRGVESNLDAAFTCDALNLAMIKDQAVAKRHHGKLYDVVCRFR